MKRVIERKKEREKPEEEIKDSWRRRQRIV